MAYAVKVHVGTRSVKTTLMRVANWREDNDARLSPRMCTSPARAGRIPASVRISVDFPAPFGPSRHTIWPGRSVARSPEATGLRESYPTDNSRNSRTLFGIG